MMITIIIDDDSLPIITVDDYVYVYVRISKINDASISTCAFAENFVSWHTEKCEWILLQPLSWHMKHTINAHSFAFVRSRI